MSARPRLGLRTIDWRVFMGALFAIWLGAEALIYWVAVGVFIGWVLNAFLRRRPKEAESVAAMPPQTP